MSGIQLSMTPLIRRSISSASQSTKCLQPLSTGVRNGVEVVEKSAEPGKISLRRKNAIITEPICSKKFELMEIEGQKVSKGKQELQGAEVSFIFY